MIKLKIEGMSCNHCVGHVQQALAGVAGVQGSVEVSLAKGEALVPGAPDLQSLLAAVDEAGYTATLVP